MLRARFLILFRWLFCRRRYLILALSCCFGAACGILAAFRSEESVLSLMRIAAGAHVSIVGLSVSAFLPFLFAAFAVYIRQPWFLCILCFVRMLAFTYLGCCMHLAFGSAGWLLRCLFQFTDSCTLALLCWFSLRQLSACPVFPVRDLAVCSAFCLITCVTDYLMISPFLASLI